MDCAVPSSEKTLATILFAHANSADRSGAMAFHMMDEQGREERCMTWRDLHDAANRLASRIHGRTVPGDRVLLMYPPGLDFVVAFLACLYARAVAVPVNPPRKNQKLGRLVDILEDSRCALVLSSPDIRDLCAGQDDLARHLGSWLVSGEDEGDDVLLDQPPEGDPDSLAMLQYTSGSTGSPKGVMVSNGNLVHNLELISRAFAVTPDSKIVSWLPMFHDMGLIGVVLAAVYSGGTGIVMSPGAFLRRPALWLKAISAYRATHSCCPNFGFEHACRRIRDEELDGIDLSSWQVAVCGAEPIRKHTFDAFARRFAALGFTPGVLTPSYGMAETTLAVTAVPLKRDPVYDSFAEAGEPAGRRKPVASCGVPGLDTDLAIVDPETLRPCPDGQVGEIWVASPSVARGYWGLVKQTEDSFRAVLATDPGRGPFLRTGDLGYLRHGELYVTGRRSDLIIIRGRNYYPQDVELLAEGADEALLHGGGAAFSIEADGEERLVVLQELERKALGAGTDKPAVAGRIRQVLGEELGLAPYRVVLLKPGKVLKTSSGKVRRRASKAAFLDGTLQGVVGVFGPGLDGDSVLPESAASTPPSLSRQDIALRLRAKAAHYLKCDEAGLDMSLPLSHFGMDSVTAAEIAMDLEQVFDIALPPTALYDHPDILSLTAFIAGRLGIPDHPDSQVPPVPATAPPAADPAPADSGPGDIAVIGLAAQMPGADTVEAFWRNLLDGRDCVVRVPDDRWPGDFYDPDRAAPDRSYSRWAGLIDGVDCFDPQFFNISPREAEFMDPQQRLFLQQAMTALEQAGYPDRALSGSNCGVFVGCSDGDYRNILGTARAPAGAYTLMGNSNSILAARIAYFLDLHGVCTTIDTACSSSLVAVHLACESLRSGSCDMALAGGVCVLSTPQFHILASKAGMLSTEGRCKTFDDGADGFVPAEGVGVVVLKRLDRAVRDGDRIHAVIRASGANQDGRTNGITAPSGPSQTALASTVYDRFGIDPRRIGYVEAHGTGTRLGDPIEVAALTAAFRRHTDDIGFCAIGSVKTNIGHALAAAGVAGLIKAVLAVREGRLPASLHCREVNAHIGFRGSPFRLLPETRDWTVAEGERRMAAVSSFGFSGTNAHVVVEAYPQPAIPVPPSVPGPTLVLLSAKTGEALRRRAADLLSWIEGDTEGWPLREVAGALAVRRSHFSHRLPLVAASMQELREGLSRWLDGASDDGANTLLDEAALEAAVASVALGRLAGHYAAGGDLPFDRLFPGPFGHPPLPTYSFEKERCWIAASPGSEEAEAGTPVEAETVPPVPGHYRAEVERDVVQAVSTVLKLDPGRIGLKADIRDFGFDSINVTELTGLLNERYGTAVTPPEMFEHRTLASLVDSLLEDYGDRIAARLTADAAPEPATVPTLAPAAASIRVPAPDRAPGPGGAVRDDPIAIIGIAGTLPGAATLDAFWDRLLAGDDLISTVPADRWDWRRGYGNPLETLGQTKVNRGGFMPAVDRFDAGFFGISRREANLMDPQQRLFLQAVWHAVENAGIRPADLAGTRTGVFVGIFTADYNELLIDSGQVREAHAITGLAHSILPNRVSYLLDLHGPSVPVDTACSSSLVALHQAVESIRAGTSDMALVGGVNVMASQTPFMSASRAGMISEDGRCKTFDRRADGYARGEGVGAILIKPLARALEDGDPIHAVIRGTAVNHGGAANSLTSPNPEAQADVIIRAMERAGLPPDRITYVEAHGTGTSLGDPIEINGLKKAYRHLYAAHGLAVEPGRSAIGTVKTSIGHLEAAAGIAGVLKVVLALKHRRLHGNIHFQERNPYIDLEGSPFVLQTEARAWEALTDDQGDPLPRCAGISSFGFGGANAHVVLEEWPRPEGAVPEDDGSRHLVLLSARSAERLAAAAAGLKTHLEREAPALADLAYTLQCGRTHWPHRLALVCGSMGELIGQLDAIAAGALPATPSSSPGNDAAIEQALRLGDLEPLRDAWLAGRDVAWERLRRDRPARRLPLPGYPFAPDRHWVSPARPAPGEDKAPGGSLAPFAEPVPRGAGGAVGLGGLTPDGYYFTDHVVAGQPVLPGAASLEIMRAAAAAALGGPVAALHGLRWMAPVTPRNLGAGLKLALDGVRGRTDRVALCVRSSHRAGGREVRHCEAEAETGALPPARPLDLDEIRRRCKGRIDVAGLYDDLGRRGLAYGESFRAIREIRAGDGEVLAVLELPPSRRSDGAGDVLPPGLIDSAFQSLAVIVQSHPGGGEAGLLVPYRVGRLDIHAPLPDRVLAHGRLRAAPGQAPDASAGWSFDITLSAPDGKVLADIHDFDLRDLTPGARTPARPAASAAPTRTEAVPARTETVHYWTTAWQAAALPTAMPDTAGTVLLLAADDTLARRLRRERPAMRVVLATPHDGFADLGDGRYGIDPDRPEDYAGLLAAIDGGHLPDYCLLDRWTAVPGAGEDASSTPVLRVFHLLKAMTAHPARLTGRLVVATAGGGDYAPEHAAIAGLLKSAALENGKLGVRLVDFAGAPPADALLAELFDAGRGPAEVRHAPEGRLVRRVVPRPAPDAAGASLLKEGGVYWITGGAGGIGRIVARHLARTRRARIVLSGRRREDDDIRAALAEIEALGGTAAYLPADTADADGLRSAVAGIRRRFGTLDGVFHGAGVLRDSLIANKGLDDFRTVLEPKIRGLANLDEACAGLPLDLFVAFSSVSGVNGNIGQSDYAAGNAFMDAFVARRNRKAAAGRRQGRAVAINWPLWAEGGMSVPRQMEAMIKGMTGMDLLSTPAALEALEAVLRDPAGQAIVATGDRSRIDAFFGAGPAAEPQVTAPLAVPATPAPAPASVPGIDPARLRRRTEEFLIQTLSAAVGLGADEVEVGTPFQNLGVDSFIILQLINDLEQDFGPLPKTLLFENHCVADLAGYFIAEHEPALLARFGLTPEAPANPPAAAEPPPAHSQSPAPSAPLLFAERDLGRTPELSDPTLVGAVRELIARHGAESTAMGRGNFAPDIFLDSGRRGLFYCNRRGDIFVTFGYVGPLDHLDAVLRELEEHCARERLQLNIVEGPAVLDIRGDAFTATPFAVLQRVDDLPGFSLDGKAMRRLRYLVAKFEKTDARTREYTAGTDADTDAAILSVIERWCAGKVMVNPYVERLVADIRTGRLGAPYRLFLTEIGGTLQAVVIISDMPSHDGWLMDCEFYPEDMPAGGLEFTIVNIIEVLRREGRRMFSLGITWGAEVADAGRADPQTRRVLADLAERGIFDGRGNLQFKNKFRPDNTQIYLFRDKAETRERVLDIILTIANSKSAEDAHAPAMEAPARKPAPSPAAPAIPAAPAAGIDRMALLEQAGFNPANIEAGAVEFDLATDSWAKLDQPWLAAAGPAATTDAGEGLVTGLLRGIFPFAHLVLTRSGDEAERCLWNALEAPGRRLLQNLMFPTFIYNALNAGYKPEEVAEESGPGFGSLLDLERLREKLAAGAGEIGAVCIEVLTNATGGRPVPAEHLQAVKALTAPLGIPLVVDATRILDNAHARTGDGADPEAFWDEVRRTLAVADIVTASLTKNFRVRRGGLVATGDFALYRRLRDGAGASGPALEPGELGALAAALADPERLRADIARRRAHVARFAAALRRAGLPLAEQDGQGEGGHAVLVHVTAMPAFRAQPHPHAAFLHHLYRETGIRGGLHSTGMRRNPPLDGMVRLAVPAGLPEPLFAAMLQRVAGLSPAPAGLDTLEVVSRRTGFAADVTARYRKVPPPGEGPSAGGGSAPVSVPRGAGTPQRGRRTGEDVPVAIIGVAGRYPKADTLDAFWRNLLEGRDCIEQRPLARWGEPLPTDHEGIPALRWGGFMDGMEAFDSLFFGISPREAALLDPQERMFMEVAWETLEDAGYTPESLVRHDPARKVGVYVGAVWQLYQVLGAEQTRDGNIQTPNSLLWSVANRVSAFMNFTGPSLAVDTACSGSLASIHLACQAIANGEIGAAIAGGVNFDLHASKWLLTQAGGFLSPDGRCRAFGKGANGYVAGEGIGAVLLKPLDRALADGDNVHGVIRACAFNHGGRASGYSVPNPNAQADLVAEALETAGIDARTVNCIEAHGTGTQLGDPIEVQGLTGAFRRFTDRAGFCSLGSVKSNIGHLEAAAGIAGLTKVLLQMRHRTLVPSLHCDEPNELIPFAASPFRLQTKAEPWEPVTLDGVVHPLRAGISSFGAGGANLHLIVEEPPPAGTAPAEPAEPSATDGLFPLSARTEEQLRAAARRLADFLAAEPEVEPRDLAFTLQHGRQSMQHRLAVTAGTVKELCEGLEAYLAGNARAGNVHCGTSRDVRALGKLLSPDEIARLVRDRIEAGQADGLAQAWTQGLLADFSGLAPAGPARRVSLPTYPFEKARHWIRTATTAQPTSGPVRPAGLHPLLDSNQSGFDGVVYRKAIDGGQYVFTDHIVAEHPTLPGVAYIEMACAAHRQALGTRPARIRNLVWAAPITAATRSDISVALTRAAGATACEITTRPPGGAAAMHAQCKLDPDDGVAAPEPLDLDAIRARFDRHTDKARCYDLLGRLQFRYGECLQAIDGVDHNETEGLTRLVLPRRLAGDFDAYDLHPSLMDGAVQSIIAIVQGETGAQGAEGGRYTPYVPFVVGEIRIHHPLTPVCYAHIRLRRGPRDVDSIKKVDVTIVDETGRVLVDMREFALKAFSMDEIAAVMSGGAPPTILPAAPVPPAAVPATIPTTVPAADRPREDVYLCAAWE